ncbi:MAG TPA: maleylpyruvate isomerase N-terminal domain-containing protein [Candidatus Dormibacteraeota bacterium]|nr:maleylpyruvate isomerase N-terminal domain-containing protein [Candidatus Dormibacteraeota bacterium]
MVEQPGRTDLEAYAARIRGDRQLWRELVAAVGDRTDEPGPMGDWTFGDLAGHLAGWRERLISRLEAAARGEPEPQPPWPAELDDDDRINDWIHERDRGRSAKELIADYDSSFERLAVAVEALPPRLLEDPAAFGWMGGEALRDADPTGHLREEHEPTVRAWLAGRG